MWLYMSPDNERQLLAARAASLSCRRVEVADGDWDDPVEAPDIIIHQRPTSQPVTIAFHHHFFCLPHLFFHVPSHEDNHFSTYTIRSLYPRCPTKMSTPEFIQPIYRARILTSLI